MYPTRIVLRPAQGHRVAKAAPSLCRGMASCTPAPFWGASRQGLSPFTGNSDMAPFFRLLDDTTRAFDNFPSFLNNNAAGSQQQQVWKPRFDVKELEESYELRGELPGVDAENLDVQFTDATTLVVRGRTESDRTKGQASNAVAADTAAAEAEADNSDAASVHSDSSYVQPTVEDDAAETASTLAGNQETPAESAAAAPAEQPEQQPKDSSTYWLSERRTGTFQRTFSFPQRIDQEGVTASLKNGILNVTVPKAAVPAPRRIAVL